ncbi:MAG: hypothetical protein IPL78_34660 [Chloroflexi bacterium]|nr:hypothetical protein [Chloroflexota bacterium]
MAWDGMRPRNDQNGIGYSRPHHLGLEDLRRKGGAGNGQKRWWLQFATLRVTCKHISGQDSFVPYGCFTAVEVGITI